MVSKLALNPALSKARALRAIVRNLKLQINKQINLKNTYITIIINIILVYKLKIPNLIVKNSRFSEI